MRKTPFAGLTELDPEESLDVDGGSFQHRNPLITDHLLHVGAVTHRHDEHAALADPLVAPSATTASAGGGFPAGSDYYVAYTLLDAEGGETLTSPVTVVSTQEAIEDPVSAPAVTAITTGGSLRAGTYTYAYTLLDAHGGETLPSDDASVERPYGPPSGSVVIEGMGEAAALAGAVGWRVYKAGAAGVYHFLAEGTGVELIDDGTLCADCASRPPDVNRTRQTSKLTVTVPPDVDGDGFRLWISTVGDFIGAFAGEYPVASAGVAIDFTQLVTGDGAPPDVSLSVPGATKINPATELAPATGRQWANVGIAGSLVERAASAVIDDANSVAHPIASAYRRGNPEDRVQFTTDGPVLVRIYGRLDVAPDAAGIDVVGLLDGTPITAVGHFAASGQVALMGSAVVDVTGSPPALQTTPLELLITADGDHEFELVYAGAAAAIGERRLIFDPRMLT